MQRRQLQCAQQAKGGSKRLLRIVNGVPTEAAKIDDGGYIEGQWYHIEVQAQLQKLSIRISEASKKASVTAVESDIDLLDGSFMSGSIGFYTSSLNSACFDRVRVKPLPCRDSDENKSLPPYPPQCSNYREAVSCAPYDCRLQQSSEVGRPVRGADLRGMGRLRSRHGRLAFALEVCGGYWRGAYDNRSNGTLLALTSLNTLSSKMVRQSGIGGTANKVQAFQWHCSTAPFS